MITFLRWATIVSAVLMVVLAVAREVPLLDLITPPKGWPVWRVTTPLAAMLITGKLFEDDLPGRLLLCTAWALALAYLWWAVAWHLTERR